MCLCNLCILSTCTVARVDLTILLQVIRRDGELALSELTHREGRMAGSTRLDDMFRDYVREVFGPEDFDAWIADWPDVFSKIKDKYWEDAKKEFDGSQDVVVDLPARIMNTLPDEVMLLLSSGLAGCLSIKQAAC